MSDDNVNLQKSEENPVEAILDSAEAAQDPAGDSAEPSTQSGAEGAEEVELIDVSTLVGSQAHDEDKKRTNEAFAKKRIELKQAKEALEQNKFTASAEGTHKPRRIDYLNDDVLFDKYGGNAEYARAAYEDALDDYNDQQRESINAQRSNTQQQVDNLTAIHEAEELYEQNAAKIAPRVDGFDSKVRQAEINLGYDATVAIKAAYPEASPLMLAAIGADRNLSNKISSMIGTSQVFIELTRLESNVAKALTPNKTLSTAPEEMAVVGSIGNGKSLDAAIEAAEEAGDYQESIRLKKQAGRWR